MDPLPLSDEHTRWIFRRAGTLAIAGAEPVGPIVLPTAKFFPDKFDRTPASVGKLFDRLKGHVGLTDVPTEVVIVDPEEGRVVSSCSSGGCGTSGVKTLSGERVTEDENGNYVVTIATQEVGHPTVLTTALSRALGQIFLREADVLRMFASRERASAGDLAATLLGLGVLIANGSAIQVKGCGGIKVHSATGLSAPEAVLAASISIARAVNKDGDAAVDRGAIEAGLDPVARSLFPAAEALVRGNKTLVRMLDDAPATLEKDNFAVRPPRGASLTSRILSVLGVGKNSDAVDPLEALEREAAMRANGAASTRDGAPRARAANDRAAARRAELRALVEESFESGARRVSESEAR